MQHSVKISTDFFSKSLRDYANWKWAWVRELVQNGVDAGSNTIKFTVTDNDDGTCTAVCENDGPPMDRETLLNKFFSLGGSTKDNGASIGGFGAAKICICFAHASYSIHTGNLLVRGAGGGFELLETEYFPGVKTTVTMNVSASSINYEIRKFLSYMQGRAGLSIFHNGYDVPLTLMKNRARRALSFGTVHVNKSREDLVVVRVNGVPMFYDTGMTSKCVILELTKSSVETLTANRDGLKYGYQGEFNKFIQELAVNKRSALRSDVITVQHFEGVRVGVLTSKQQQRESVAGEPIGGSGIDESDRGGDSAVDSVAIRGVGGGGDAALLLAPRSETGLRGAVTGLEARRNSYAVCENFFSRNELGIKIPKHYLPYRHTFSAYSRRLVKKWSHYLTKLHELFDVSGVFSVGFVFSEEVEALYESNATRGLVYYINPAKVVKQVSSGSRSLRKRFSAKDDCRLLMIALHEFLHGRGYNYHDEEFAARLTDYAGIVAANLKLFRSK